MTLVLSAHFTLDEMTASAAAVAHGLENTPSSEEIANLRRLCARLLEPLRARLGRPVVVNSAYRSCAVNSLVGGSWTSDHMTGCAADIEVPGVSNSELAELIVASGLEFDQLIRERLRDDDPTAGWIHVSLRPHGNRRQVLDVRSRTARS